MISAILVAVEGHQYIKKILLLNEAVSFLPCYEIAYVENSNFVWTQFITTYFMFNQEGFDSTCEKQKGFFDYWYNK